MRPRLPARLAGRVRRPVAFAGLAAMVAALVVAGLELTPPPVRPHLLPGDIWLTSRAVGQITLVDGVSAEVSAAVSVSGPDDHFDTEQSATAGYAVNSASGEVVRVSDATLQTAATTLSGGPTVVYANGPTLFAVNQAERTVQVLAPETLTRIGGGMSLPGPNPPIVSDGNTLWAADGPTGTLASYGEVDGVPMRHVDTTLFSPAKSQPRLTNADGQPVLIDPEGRTASLLTSTAQVNRTMRLDLRSNDIVSGATDSTMIDIVQPDHGLLIVCDFGNRSCQPGIPLTGLDHSLGPAVQWGGHVYVPDYTTDVVRIVDLGTGLVRQTSPLFDHPIRFQLLQRDHIVYFNDPDSEKAGVITADGRLRRINKYDPRHPLGVAVTTGPHPSRSGPPTPTTVPVPTGSGPAIPAPVGGAAAAGGTLPVTTVPTATGPHIVSISTDPPTPEATQSLTFSAQVTGMPTSWAWTITDATGNVTATASTPQLVHTFATPGVYEAKLTITAGALRDSQSLQVTVIPYSPPVHCGETVLASVVLTSDLNCTGTAISAGAPDITIDLGGHTVTGTADGITDNEQPGVKIRNGTIRGGLNIDGGAFQVVSQVNADEIVVADTTNTKIEESTTTGLKTDSTLLSVIDTTVGGDGMRIQGQSPFISGCTIVNSGIGFNLVTGQGFAVLNNTFIGSSMNLTQSDGETISGNNFEGNGGGGILLQESRSALIENNHISGMTLALAVNDILTTNDVIQNNVFDRNGYGIYVNEQSLDFMAGSKIINNTFTNNGVAGIDIEASAPGTSDLVTISGNMFASNGNHAGGAVDTDGHPISDGLHIDVPVNSTLLVTGNNTHNDAEYGIDAQPDTVRDGGGNVSRGDPKGCLGVQCG